VESEKGLEWLYRHLIHLIVLCEIVKLKGIKLMPTIKLRVVRRNLFKLG